MKRFSLLFITTLIVSAGCASPSLKVPGTPKVLNEGSLREDIPAKTDGGKKDNDSVVAQILKDVEKLLSAGRPEKAVIELENAARISPKRADIYLRLGEIRYDQQLCHQATGMARKARQLGLTTTANTLSANHIITGCSGR